MVTFFADSAYTARYLFAKGTNEQTVNVYTCTNQNSFTHLGDFLCHINDIFTLFFCKEYNKNR